LSAHQTHSNYLLHTCKLQTEMSTECYKKVATQWKTLCRYTQRYTQPITKALLLHKWFK